MHSDSTGQESTALFSPLALDSMWSGAAKRTIPRTFSLYIDSSAYLPRKRYTPRRSLAVKFNPRISPIMDPSSSTVDYDKLQRALVSSATRMGHSELTTYLGRYLLLGLWSL